MRLRKTAVVLVATLMVAGCSAFSGTGSRPEGHRLIEGALDVATATFLGRQSSVQIVAVSWGQGEPAFYMSSVLDPSSSSEVPFVVAVDEDEAFSILLQVPSSGGQGLGSLLAVYEFSGASSDSEKLIPAGAADLQLSVPVEDEGNPPALRGAEFSNPLSQVDSDLDGVVDRDDDDDDDDGIPDALDDDVAGDGTVDHSQGYEGFADENENGVADLWE
ncbi:MAG: hypothetical protein GY822_30640 [Deltaproteobacteria bacterium]|nr:hypothetical protein [Deltaproteobacteria bacterium]